MGDIVDEQQIRQQLRAQGKSVYEIANAIAEARKAAHQQRMAELVEASIERDSDRRRFATYDDLATALNEHWWRDKSKWEGWDVWQEDITRPTEAAVLGLIAAQTGTQSSLQEQVDALAASWRGEDTESDGIDLMEWFTEVTIAVRAVRKRERCLRTQLIVQGLELRHVEMGHGVIQAVLVPISA